MHDVLHSPEVTALLAQHRPVNASTTPAERRLMADAERVIAHRLQPQADTYWTQQAAAMLVLGKDRAGASCNVSNACRSLLAATAVQAA